MELTCLVPHFSASFAKSSPSASVASSCGRSGGARSAACRSAWGGPVYLKLLQFRIILHRNIEVSTSLWNKAILLNIVRYTRKDAITVFRYYG